MKDELIRIHLHDNKLLVDRAKEIISLYDDQEEICDILTGAVWFSIYDDLVDVESDEYIEFQENGGDDTVWALECSVWLKAAGELGLLTVTSKLVQYQQDGCI